MKTDIIVQNNRPDKFVLDKKRDNIDRNRNNK